MTVNHFFIWLRKNVSLITFFCVSVSWISHKFEELETNLRHEYIDPVTYAVKSVDSLKSSVKEQIAWNMSHEKKDSCFMADMPNVINSLQHARPHSGIISSLLQINR